VPGKYPRKGDIYHVDFAPPIGPHYAVVVSSDMLNENIDSVIVAVITSQRVDQCQSNEYKVPDGLLAKPSKVKCQTLITIPKGRLGNYVATMDQKDILGMGYALAKALDLWVM
jgi:mRNA-degrading endonuclease toxin of MazEF toxin-antitoxin module